MKTIKIHISKLGLIRDADIEITPFILFSGESGLGKSYAAILCHYFFYVWLSPIRLQSFFNEKGQDIKEGTTEDHSIPLEITKAEIEQWLAVDAVDYLRYMLGYDSLNADITVELPSSIPEKIPFDFEREIVGINSAEEIYNKLTALHVSYRYKSLGLNDENPYSYVLRYAIIREIFDNLHALTASYVLPPSRGSFLSESVNPITGLWESYVNSMKELDRVQEIPEKVSKSLVNLFQTVLDGEVKKSGDRYVYVTHGDTLPISAAASSVREAGPLQIMIKKRDISKMAILIEEPEAHLHPIKQQMMADIIGIMAKGGARMQITTHSDYFLKRINDLVRLHILKKKMDENDFDKFCKENNFNPEFSLDTSILSAYFLHRRDDGSVEILRQDVNHGIPFDSFKEINGKPMANSARLYELTIGEE